MARGIPESAVSIGLVHGHRTAADGVRNRLTGEGGVAAAGGPAEFWGLLPAKASAECLEDAVASISRSEMEDGSVQPKSEWNIRRGVELLASRGPRNERFDGLLLRFGQGDACILNGAVRGPRGLVGLCWAGYR